MKAYLGDSVYVEYDGYSLTLTTENGYGPNNTIIMEPKVYSELVKFVLKEEAQTKDNVNAEIAAWNRASDELSAKIEWE